MEYIFIPILLACIVFSYLNHRRNMELLCSVSSPERGTEAERRLIIKMLKKGVHPKAIFHDLYLQKKNGEYSQIDIVVATPQGLIAIEVKDYSGWIFGNERQKYWTQILNYGKEKYRFYNPIMQNAGHIKALQEQSEQFAGLPIFNVVLFAGDSVLKDVSYMSANTYVGYNTDIKYVLKKVSEVGFANYTNKKEVAGVLRQAVNNGNDSQIIADHIASVQRNSKGQPQPIISYSTGLLGFCLRKLFRF